jgi:hypothetical protein
VAARSVTTKHELKNKPGSDTASNRDLADGPEHHRIASKMTTQRVN